MEFIKDFQQDLIAEFEKVTGKELSKEFLPEHLANEIQRKKEKTKVKHLYQVFGISKQAFYKRKQAASLKVYRHQQILDMVRDVRKMNPRAGTRKLMFYIQPKLSDMNLKKGRDALFSLLRNNDLLLKKTKRSHITTNSKHFFYTSPNLLRETDITHAEQALVTDITYIKTDQGHAYLALATAHTLRKLWAMRWKTI